MDFSVIQRGARIPGEGQSITYLKADNWNDYSFRTLFQIYMFDEYGAPHDLGNIKIAFKGQTEEVSTYSTLSDSFTALPDDYFSLGMEAEYYQTISNLSEKTRSSLLSGLRDIVASIDVIDSLLEERVFKISLLRDVSLSAIRGQFKRVLDGGIPLTDFEFLYRMPVSESTAEIELEFAVKASSKPSTNIHALIGRNGVGKTTILNGMTDAVVRREDTPARFYRRTFFEDSPIDSDYFSRLVTVSFSAFDPFTPPQEQPDPTLGVCYFHIGIKGLNELGEPILKPLAWLHQEFVTAIGLCLSQEARRGRWLKAISTLESDENFEDMALSSLSELSGDELKEQSLSHMRRMSSGHAVVLLTVTRLVAAVEEKTLVLIDEPESHLHPPLLSAFTRALSELLHDRNGVAITATHSPVVLQEIPASNVWKVQRSRLVMAGHRPESETFGENVGTLTREVFGLEVVKSGFIRLLKDSVSSGGSYENIVDSYGDQLGYEARAILRALIESRDREIEQ